MPHAGGVNRRWSAQARHVRESFPSTKSITIFSAAKGRKKAAVCNCAFGLGWSKLLTNSICENRLCARMGGAALPLSDDASEAEMTH